MDVLQVKQSLYWWVYFRLNNPFTEGCIAGYTIPLLMDVLQFKQSLYWWMYCRLNNPFTEGCTACYTIPLLSDVLQVIQSLYWRMYFKILPVEDIYTSIVSWIDQRELAQTNIFAIFYRVVFKNIYSSLKKVT